VVVGGYGTAALTGLRKRMANIAIELNGAISVPPLALAVTVTQHIEAHIVDREAVGRDDRLAQEQVDDSLEQRGLGADWER
jgi:hypothetical protein